MATYWLTEYNEAPPPSGLQIMKEPGIAVQTATFSTSTQSTAFRQHTHCILMQVDTTGYYSVGPNPTASATTNRLPADTLIYIGVAPGDKIAFATS